MEPYSDSIEHLQDEISRLDLLLKRAVVIARQAGPGTESDEIRGLVVTENEIDDILRTKDLLGETWERAAAREPELTRIDKELDKRRKQIDARVEPGYETLYAYLQNDVTRKHPSVNLALNLICRSEREKLAARSLFSPWAPLMKHCLLELAEESQDRQPSLLRKFLK